MDTLETCEVWAENLDAEMNVIRDLIEYYPYIGMVSRLASLLYVYELLLTHYPHSWMNQDTEFPGVVARPIGTFKTPSDYHYQTLRCNVDLLRIIQLGLTLCDEKGRKPEGKCVWQFNFRFSLKSVLS